MCFSICNSWFVQGYMLVAVAERISYLGKERLENIALRWNYCFVVYLNSIEDFYFLADKIGLSSYMDHM